MDDIEDYISEQDSKIQPLWIKIDDEIRQVLKDSKTRLKWECLLTGKK